MDIFSQIGKAVDAAANAVGDAIKKTDFNEIGKTVDAAANDVAKNVDPFAVGAAATGGVAGAGLFSTSSPRSEAWG